MHVVVKNKCEKNNQNSDSEHSCICTKNMSTYIVYIDSVC